jgi:hypothetical protein
MSIPSGNWAGIGITIIWILISVIAISRGGH